MPRPLARPPVFVPTSHSAKLSGRVSRDTGPELVLRSALHRRGARFSLHRRLAGTRLSADVVLRRHGLAVFVDGCFWHGCPVHRSAPKSGPNVEAWRAKMEANRERDLRADAAARSEGLVPVRVWECEIRTDADAVASHVLSLSTAA